MHERACNKTAPPQCEQHHVAKTSAPALEHPQRLLMNLESADNEVLGFEIIGSAGRLTQRVSVPHKNFMTLDKMRHEVLRGNTLHG